MKALTICQPYPKLILTPQAELPAGYVQKRVENRSWSTTYRGPLLIHAGLSMEWVTSEDLWMLDPLVFGAILGVVDLVDCVEVVVSKHEPLQCRWIADEQKHPWLKTHPHASGRFCWVLENPRLFEQPIPYSGKQGLFNVPDEVVRGVVGS